MGFLSRRDVNYGSKGDVQHRIESDGEQTYWEDKRDVRRAAREARQVTEAQPVPSTKMKKR